MARIIDAHAHLGKCCVFGLDNKESDLVRGMDQNKIDAAIVQPYPGARDAVKAHDEIAELCTKYPGRFYGLASMTPHQDRDAYRRELERCIKQLKFVGVKVHTIGHSVNPLSEDADLVFSSANELGIPVMVHTGPGVPFALPSLCIPPARKYPSLNIVLAHAGFAVFTAEAQVAASVCSNLYLETSWCIADDIGWMISTIGSKRVMLGSDLINNIPVEVAKFKALNLNPDVWAQVMGQTAIDVFKLPQ